MPKISLDNLERYDGHLKDWCDARFASKSVNENWSETEEAGAVQFYPVSDTEIHPVVKFSFKETPPISGDKSSTNPSTITGVSSVKVTRCGKNLLKPFSNSSTKNYVTLTPNSDGSYTVNGTATANTNFNFMNVRMNETKYFLSGCPSGGAGDTYYLGLGGGVRDVGSGAVYTNVGSNGKSAWIGITSGTTADNLIYKPQLELGSSGTDFEKYEGNEYTINLDNTYYGGEVDLASGIMTVTMQYMVADSNAEIIWIGTNFVAWRYPVGLDCIGRAVGTEVCSHFPFSGAWDGSFAHFYATPSSGFYFADPNWTTSTYRQYFTDQYNNGTPVTACYQLATPYTVQLTPLQIKSLTQSNLYTPRLNTVYTDADTIKVRYQKSPIVTSSDIDNAILSLGGD